MSDVSETKDATCRQGATIPRAGHGPAPSRCSRSRAWSSTSRSRKGLLQRQVAAVKAVDGIDFERPRGETLGVVGESGCGKSTMGRLITRLLEPTGGKVEFEGQDITHLAVGQMRPLRRDVQMIFQDPYCSLNPRHTIGTIVSAPFRLQGVEPEGGLKKEVQRLLELVGPQPRALQPLPARVLRRPAPAHRHRPRARAASRSWSSPTSRSRRWTCRSRRRWSTCWTTSRTSSGLTYVIIAHDLSVIRHVSDRIAVMYLGKIVELTDRKSLYEAPMHPYTKALMSAVPVPDPQAARRQERADPAQGRRAVADLAAERLPLPHAVLEGDADLQDAGAAADRAEDRPPGGLPPPGERAGPGAGRHRYWPRRGRRSRWFR